MEIKPLPKENTDLRVLLNKVSALQALHSEKIGILNSILEKCDR